MSDLALDPRLSFSKVRPKLQIAWDSVSLGAAKRCKRFYQLSILEGWQPKAESHHLRYGILYHRVGEVYEHAKADGQNHDQALLTALMDMKTGCTDGAAWWNPHQHLPEKRAAADPKTIPALFRSAVWYLDQFRHDSLVTIMLANGKPAIELSFRYNFGYTFSTGEQMLHSGHLDRLARLGKRPTDPVYVVDKKTTKNTISGNSSWGFFEKYSPDGQMSGYTYASRIALTIPADGVIIDAVQIAKGFSRFERGFTMRTEGQLEEWHHDTTLLVEDMERCVDRDYWPTNDSACDMYGGCPFRGICSKDPSVRPAYLASDFTKRYWDPLQVRGDI